MRITVDRKSSRIAKYPVWHGVFSRGRISVPACLPGVGFGQLRIDEVNMFLVAAARQAGL
jgi:hypothetical protein